MAEKLGCSLSAYAKIERGETELNYSKLEKIAKVMELDLQQLLGLSESEQPPAKAGGFE